MIDYKKAKNILKKAKIKIQDEEILIKNSLNRILAKDVVSPSDHPLGDNAAFDGFAINSNDTKYINKKNIKHFRIIGTIAAGKKPLNKKIKKFEAIEIMTGGIISKPFNTIIPIEKVIFYPSKKKPQSIIINQKFSKSSLIFLPDGKKLSPVHSYSEIDIYDIDTTIVDNYRAKLPFIQDMRRGDLINLKL